MSLKIVKSKLNLEIVILYCPYQNIENKETMDMFSKLVRLKNRGYENRHESGSIPLDTNDFIADHPLLCRRELNGELTPISGSKVISYEACKYFNLEFAMEATLKKGNHLQHMDVFTNLVHNALLNNKKLAYHGGYTMDPAVRINAESKNEVRELFASLTYFFLRQMLITDLLAIRVTKFNTEKYFNEWGYQRCKNGNFELDEFSLPFLTNTYGAMIHLSEYAPSLIALAEKYYDLWNERTEIGIPFSTQDKITKIAA